MRKPIVAGNWKMNKTVGEAIDLAAAVKQRVAGRAAVEVVLVPPFTALKPVGDLIRFSSLRLGAQDVHFEPDGAYTGEISTSMLVDLACAYVIVGHSERRAHFGETDGAVHRKTRAALDARMTPIVCVGETLEQREAGRTNDVLAAQVREGLAGLGERLGSIVVAYEPVWAIGTGRTATPAQAQEAHALIRGLIRELGGGAAADTLRIQYGGSVNPGNAAELFRQPDVDGGLVGGASLSAESFAEVVYAAEPAS